LIQAKRYQLGYDEANLSNIPPHFPGKAGSTRGPSSAETLAVGRIMVSGKRPGVELHISNGLDYVEAIDEASSSPGFVKAGIDYGLFILSTSELNLEL
jgi:hypothetical protein